MKRRLRPQSRPAHLRRLDHVPRLLELYSSDPYVAKLLKALASQDDLGSDVIPAWVELKLRCPRHEAIQTLRAVGGTKVADFKLGRKGHRTRLEWGFLYGEEVAQEVINEVNKRLYSLAQKADRGDEEAQTVLTKMATVAGFWQEEVDAAESWAAVAKMIAPGCPGGQQVQASEETPSDTPPELVAAEGVTVRSSNPVESRFVDTKILLRPDLWVTLSLPKDLTEDEAERLAGIVCNLWLVPSKGSWGSAPVNE